MPRLDRRALLVSLLTAAACSIPQPPAADRTDPEAKGDESVACPAYAGLVVGSVSTWALAEPNDTDAHGWMTTSVTAACTDQVTTETTTEWTWDDGARTTVDATRTYRCDADGAWLLTEEASWWIGIDDEPTTTGSRETTFDDRLHWPADLGTGWTSSWTQTAASDGGDVDTTEATETYTVAEDLYVIEVPAGIFDVLQITKAGDPGNTLWVHEELGLVADESWDLTEHAYTAK